MELTGVLPVALEPAQSASDQSANALQKSANIVDRTLVDYVGTFQAQGALGQQIGNPAAIGSEALRILDGYLQRVSNFRNKTGERVSAMSGNTDNSAGIEVAAVDSAGLAPGPAARMLESSSTPSGVQGQEGVSSIGGRDVDHAIQMLSEILSFALETTAITSITTNITKSTSTLLRGS